MTYTPDVAWQIAGLIVVVLTGIGKYLKWIPDDRIVKQLSALVFSVIVVVAYPYLQGQPLPAMGIVLFNIFQTWLTAQGGYAVINTIQKKAKAEPVATGKKTPKTEEQKAKYAKNHPDGK